MYGMNQGFGAPDPSAQVPAPLLPHIHLLSLYRFPQLPNLAPQHALDYLIKAPAIVKDAAGVAWHFLAQPPQDGTILLAWQPPRLGTHIASDGLVWADAEVAYDMNVKGYQLQVLVHKSGYIQGHEQFTQHARYRYRLANGPGPFDPNLWLIHYVPADPTLRIPAAQIPISRETGAQLTMRAQLMQSGQLIRKEFMLHDSPNWPKVEFTPHNARGQQAYYNPMQPGPRPYAQPPPAKRQRLPNQSAARQPATGSLPADTSLEEEENATQDSFDFLSPREISLSRYKQHHEWMEEIFSSPHSMGKIMPIDLGLGLMGELAPLTADLLDAPSGDAPIDKGGEVNPSYSKRIKDYCRLQPEQLKEFEARVAAYRTQESAELVKMKAAHAKKMTELKRSRTYIKAERRLRDVPRSTSVSGGDEDEKSLHAVITELEKSLGVVFETKKLVSCIDKGGFQEIQQPQPEKSQINGNGLRPSNSHGSSAAGGRDSGLDGENTAGSLLDQFGNGSLTGTPGGNLSVSALSQAPSQPPSARTTPNAAGVEANQNASFNNQGANFNPSSDENNLLALDVEMSGMTSADGKGGDAEWAMVEDQNSGSAQSGGVIAAQPAGNSRPAGAVPATNIDAEAGGIFDTADFGSFDNLDTAGDALADYSNVGDDNLGLDLVDDSAFGDAFHSLAGDGEQS